MNEGHGQLVYYLKKNGTLRSENVIAAFETVDRADFVPERHRNLAYEDVPLSIGSGQTISQPLVVAFMLELLEVQPGQRVLDAGAGSGWVTALLAHLVGSNGKVVALERIKKLAERGRTNVSKYGYVDQGIVEYHHGDAVNDIFQWDAFNRIHAAASSKSIPDAWKQMTAPHGIIVAPVERSVVKLIRRDDGDFKELQYFGYSFVPLVGD